jgi:hypothetical protein
VNAVYSTADTTKAANRIRLKLRVRAQGQELQKDIVTGISEPQEHKEGQQDDRRRPDRRTRCDCKHEVLLGALDLAWPR